ncbi:uncharacterized protein I303_103578 [Kwoniella dejecticola CBS 10117]|uniref:Uncharacterized protein n=1 Tax=Kwoniella dejecticola CBS 10117 TaxID=1296121 RepID=A0A1A6A752_9TREE|nr:uncharacterized protein I303_03600 [Kwoniella dejecticola CBS 10117]OBR85886.1 hypothetical protein I303_03600 [Kwoniella dejecticola CBS 10117]
MSLHRYFVPPPLALAVHPAPPPKARPTEKEKENAEKEAKDKDKKDNKQEPANNKEDKVQPDHDNKKDKAAVQPEPETPATPGSLIPEPPTPAPGALPHTEKEEKAKADGSDRLVGDAAKIDGEHTRARPVDNVAADIPGKANEKKEANSKSNDEKGKANNNQANQGTNKDKARVSLKDITPPPEAENTKAQEAEPPLEPIRLLPPAPLRPVRTKLDLNPAKPYPPINTDPRGAYHAYAKAVGNEVIYIDVTKDGWLTEQWKERSEREALKRLTGEWERELEREMEKQRERNKIKDVPSTAQGILLELWNVLAELENHEIPVDEFWAKFDWTKDKAKVHLSDVRRAVKDDDATKHGDEEKDEKEASTANDKARNSNTDLGQNSDDTKKEREIEWTKEGLEEILSSVGVQCIYNVDKPLKHWSLAPCAYLLLAHGYFLLRTDMYINFKPEEKAGKFEALITSGHDRVFGDMVKAQREKEYRERKERERKERAEKEKKQDKGKDEKDHRGKDEKDGVGKDGNSAEKEKKQDEDKDDEDEKDIEDKNKENDEDKEKNREQEEPETPTSNVKLLDGEPVLAAKDDAGVAVINPKEDKVIIAVPLNEGTKAKDVENKRDDDDKEKKRDEKHEAEAELVPAPKPAGGANPPTGGVAGLEGEMKKEKVPMNMNDIANAFKALDLTASAQAQARAKDDKDRDKVKLIWTWTERCEMWRWKNYEVGLHHIKPGGWEERDWKVFADDKEVWDFDDEQAVVELEEKDIYDWSC